MEYKEVRITIPLYIIERARFFYPRESDDLAVEFYLINKVDEVR